MKYVLWHQEADHLAYSLGPLSARQPNAMGGGPLIYTNWVKSCKMDPCEINIRLDQCRTRALHNNITTSVKTYFILYIKLCEYESTNTDTNRC